MVVGIGLQKNQWEVKKNSSAGDHPRPCFRLLFPVPANIDSIYACEKHIQSNDSTIIRNTRSLWIVRPDLPVDVLWRQPVFCSILHWYPWHQSYVMWVGFRNVCTCTRAIQRIPPRNGLAYDSLFSSRYIQYQSRSNCSLVHRQRPVDWGSILLLFLLLLLYRGTGNTYMYIICSPQ
jgi:hypothetical protein